MGIFAASASITVVFFLVWFSDSTKNKVFTLSSFPAVGLLILFTWNPELLKENYVKTDMVITEKTILSSLSIVLGYIFAAIVSKRLPSRKQNQPHGVVTPKKKNLDIAFFSMFALSAIALLANLTQVDFNLGLLLVSARQYEAAFGQKWYINYAYFLHVMVICLGVYRARFFKNNTTHKIVISLAFVFSFFHGIKFTIFDAIFFPAFLYIAIFGLTARAKYMVIFLVTLFVVIFTGFSYWIRGGGDQFNVLAFVGYIAPNYANFFFNAETNSPFVAAPFSFVAPAVLNPILPPAIPSNEFVLNDKYNMLTAFPYLLGYFGYLGVLWFYLVIIIILKNTAKRNFLASFLYSYAVFSLFMSFYSYYPLVKVKYVYFLIVAALLHLWIDRRRYGQCK